MSVPHDGRYQAWAGQPKGQPRRESNCWEEIFPAGRGLHHQCGKPWTVERGGQRFCAQHDPEAVKKKKAAREAKWEAEEKRRSEKWDRNRAVHLACEGVETKDLSRGLLARLLRATPPPLTQEGER